MEPLYEEGFLPFPTSVRVEEMSLVDELVADGVLKSPHIIEAFRAIKREDFVNEDMRDAAATVNAPLPIGHGQTISQPWTVAFMLELLEPEGGQRVLDIGAGSGWTTALLAHIVSKKGMSKSPVSTRSPRLRVGAGRRGEAGKIQMPNKVQNPNDQNESQGKPLDAARGKVYAMERVEELCVFGKANVAKYGFIGQGVVEWRCADATGGLPEHAPFDRIIAAASARELPAAWREQCAVGGVIVAPIRSSIWRFRKRADDQWDEEEHPGFAFVPFVSNGTEEKNI